MNTIKTQTNENTTKTDLEHDEFWSAREERAQRQRPLLRDQEICAGFVAIDEIARRIVRS